MTAYPAPKPLSKEEIQGVVKDYAEAAHNAVEAGMKSHLPTVCVRLLMSSASPEVMGSLD